MTTNLRSTRELLTLQQSRSTICPSLPFRLNSKCGLILSNQSNRLTTKIEAAGAGLYDNQAGKKVPKIQIFSRGRS